MRALLLLCTLLGLPGCAGDGGRYPVLDVVHGPDCGRVGKPPC